MSQRYTVLLESFQSGEVSPLLRGRIDTTQYSQGCRTLQNFVVIPQGGITRREGTEFGYHTEDPTKTSRLLPFTFDEDSSFMLEFGDGIMRPFISDGSGDSGSGTSPVGPTPLAAPDNNPTNNTFPANLTSWTAAGAGSGSISWAASGEGTTGAALFNAPNDAAQLTQGIVFTTPGTYRMTTTIGSDSFISTGIGSVLRTTTLADPYNDPAFPTDDDICPSYAVSSAGGIGTVGTQDFTITTPGTYYLYLYYAGTGDTYVDSVLIEGLIQQNSTPYASTDVGDLQIQQYGKYAILTHPNFPPYRLTYDNGLWDFSVFNMTEGPFFDIEDEDYGGIGTDIDIDTAGGAVGATITLTASSALFVSTDDDDSPNTGRLIRIRPDTSSAWGVGRIITYTNSTTVSVTVLETIAACTNTKQWRLGSWSGTTGYPRTSAVHEQRLVFGGSAAQPQTIWGSYVGQFDNFAPDDGSVDENITALTAYTFTLDTKVREVIQWLLSRESLLIGTTTQVHIARATNLNEALTARNIVVRQAVGAGCAYIPPVVSQEDILFVHLYARQLLLMQYNFDTDRQEAINMNMLSEHITDTNPIQNLAVQDYPYRLVWMGLQDGTIAGLTSVPQNRMNAWHRHILGGSFSTGNPIIESMAVKPGTNQDELWLVVKRTINGSTTRMIEVLGRAFTSSATTRTDGVFLDSFVEATMSGGVLTFANTNITDLSHLEGQTVGVMRNGVYQGTATVSSGLLSGITISGWTNGDIVHVGLRYTSIMETNTLNSDPRQGTLQGSDQRIFETIFRLHNSFTGEAGYSSAALDDLAYPSSIVPSSSGSSMFSGDIMMKLPYGWDRNSKVYLRQTDPYPMTLTLLINKLVGGQA